MRMLEGVWFGTGSRKIMMIDRVKVVVLWFFIATVLDGVEVPCVLIQIKSCKYVRVCIRLLVVELL